MRRDTPNEHASPNDLKRDAQRAPTPTEPPRCRRNGRPADPRSSVGSSTAISRRRSSTASCRRNACTLRRAAGGRTSSTHAFTAHASAAWWVSSSPMLSMARRMATSSAACACRQATRAANVSRTQPSTAFSAATASRSRGALRTTRTSAGRAPARCARPVITSACRRSSSAAASAARTSAGGARWAASLRRHDLKRVDRRCLEVRRFGEPSTERPGVSPNLTRGESDRPPAAHTIGGVNDPVRLARRPRVTILQLTIRA